MSGLRLYEALAADWICAGLNEAVMRQQVGAPEQAQPILFSNAARRLLVRAWSIAIQLESRRVIEDHLIVALATGNQSLPLQEPQGAVAGALVRLAILEVGAGSQTFETLVATDTVVRWVQAAAHIAASRADDPQLSPDDLVRALHSPARDRGTDGAA